MGGYFENYQLAELPIESLSSRVGLETFQSVLPDFGAAFEFGGPAYTTDLESQILANFPASRLETPSAGTPVSSSNGAGTARTTAKVAAQATSLTEGILRMVGSLGTTVANILAGPRRVTAGQAGTAGGTLATPATSLLSSSSSVTLILVVLAGLVLLIVVGRKAG